MFTFSSGSITLVWTLNLLISFPWSTTLLPKCNFLCNLRFLLPRGIFLFAGFHVLLHFAPAPTLSSLTNLRLNSNNISCQVDQINFNLHHPTLITTHTFMTPIEYLAHCTTNVEYIDLSNPGFFECVSAKERNAILVSASLFICLLVYLFVC